MKKVFKETRVTLYARDCTGLTAIEAPNAKTLDARGIYSFISGNLIGIGPIGSRKAWLICRKTDDDITIRAGCFFGIIDLFDAAVTETHGKNQYAKDYAEATALLRHVWGKKG